MDKRFVIVRRKTRQEELVARYNTWQQARFYLEHLGHDAGAYEAEHIRYHECLTSVYANAQKFAPTVFLERELIPDFIFRKTDIVIAVGQDGLVANVLKYAHGLPIVGVNPDPELWDGILAKYDARETVSLMPKIVKEAINTTGVSLAEARVNDGTRLLAVNDFFIGPKSHTSFRYKIRSSAGEANHSSSGVIVSTGFGSTGWYTSIIVGAAASVGQSIDPAELARPWDSAELTYCVREPFPSVSTSTDLVRGNVTSGQELSVEAQSADNGVLFADGIEFDAIKLRAGSVVRLGLAKEQGIMVSEGW